MSQHIRNWWQSLTAAQQNALRWMVVVLFLVVSVGAIGLLNR